MSDEEYSEEEAVWEAMAVRGPEREGLELLGLLPYGLEPVEPRSDVRRRLLQAVSEPPARSLERPFSLGPAVLMALAASALLVVGVQVLRLNGARTALENDRHRLEEALRHSSGREAEAVARLQAVESQLGLVAAPAAEICPLRPPATGGAPMNPGAWGALYVAADHQHWFVRLHEMEAYIEPREYHVWFLVGGQPVRAGSIQATAAPYLEVAAEGLPDSMRGVLVTLEKAGGGPQPDGPVVLSGDEMIRIL